MRTAPEILKIFTFQCLLGLMVIPTVSGEPEKDNRPRKVTVILVTSPNDACMVKTGNIKATFADGSSQLLTNDGNCRLPRISACGEIGWLRLDKTNVDSQCNRHKRRGIDTVVVQLRNGEVKEFMPDEEFAFIGDWRFADRGKSIVIKSSGYHGPRTYWRFDLETGRMLDSIEGYVPYEQLPLWAKPIGER